MEYTFWGTITLWFAHSHLNSSLKVWEFACLRFHCWRKKFSTIEVFAYENQVLYINFVLVSLVKTSVWLHFLFRPKLKKKRCFFFTTEKKYFVVSRGKCPGRLVQTLQQVTSNPVRNDRKLTKIALFFLAYEFTCQQAFIC